MTAATGTIAAMFLDRVERSALQPALWFPGEADAPPRRWTWRDVFDEVIQTASALRQLGVESGDRVAHWSENRPEWVFTDLALHLLGAIHVPIHAPLTWQQANFQATDCGAKLVILANAIQATPMVDAGHRVVRYAEPPASTASAASPTAGDLLSDFARPTDAEEVEDIEGRIAPWRTSITQSSQVATILYTSGTTGEPKGVMLTHANLVSNALAMEQMFGPLPKRRLNFLPLSHIFARTCDLYTWLAGGAELGLARSRESVFADCAAFAPETLNGVPYFFQKLQGLVEEGADVHSLLGAQIKYCCSGGAPLPVATYDFFQQRGLAVLQGYGLTETSPVISACTPDADRRGSVGRPVPGTEVRIQDDEIQARGPHVMKGYYGHPPLASEGDSSAVWLATGDLGTIDEDGFLFITGRRKELIVLSTGKNVSPTQIESRLAANPLIEQVMVVGDNRSYLASLIFPNQSQLEARATREAASDHSLLIQHEVDQLLVDFSRHEQVRRCCLISRPFSMDEGELTPKLSLKRKQIEANWSAEIEALYEDK